MLQNLDTERQNEQNGGLVVNSVLKASFNYRMIAIYARLQVPDSDFICSMAFKFIFYVAQEVKQ